MCGSHESGKSASETADETGSAPLVTGDDVGVDYAAWVEKLVEDQEARKTSLEQRGLSVITTSGALATLLFGLVTLLTKSNDYKLPTSTHGWIAGALIAFSGAAVLGLLTNVPLFYNKVKFKRGPKELLDKFEDPPATARREITATRLKEYRSAKKLNGLKAWCLVLAMLGEVVAVGLLAVAIGKVLDAA